MSAGQTIRDLFSPSRILWHHVFGYYCMGLDRFCPISAVACLDFGREYRWIEERTAIRVLSVEAGSGCRPKPKEGDVERVIPALKPKLLDLMRQEGGDSWALVCPLPNARMSSLALGLGCKAACPPAEVGNWLYDKVNLFSGLEKLRLRRLPGQWFERTGLRYAELSASMGPRLVVQRAMGGGGEGTVFVASEEELIGASRFLGECPLWIAPEVRGPSINLNAVAMDRRVVVGPPNIQLVGLEMLQCRPGMYCGNDYTTAAQLDSRILSDVREQAERIGGWVASLGFRGLFGLDFVVDADSSLAYAVDLNPRWQGSTAVGAQAEARSGRVPLAAAEIAWKLGVLGENEVADRADEFFAPVRASQMSFRLDRSGWRLVNADLMPGIYSPEPSPAFLRPGIELDDLHSLDECLVTGAVPHMGCMLGPESYPLRVYAERPVMDLASGQPLPWAREFAAAIYDALRLEPVPDPLTLNQAG